MALARLIYVKVDPSKVAEAQKVWKEDCAPLMIKQPGCMSEQLLQSLDDPAEMISYSEWQDEQSIERYLQSDDHKEIVRHSRGLSGGSPAVVKRYTIAG